MVEERGEWGKRLPPVGIKCEGHGHFIYASERQLVECVTVSADSLVSIGSRWPRLSVLESMYWKS
jgi:hypothetical protein